MRIFRLVIIFFLIASAYFYRNSIIASADSFLYQSPCDYPIGYRIGSIDPKFNLTEKEFADDIKTAADLWNRAISKPLFSLDPEGTLTINLIYDERQFLKGKVNELNGQVQNKQNSLDPQIADYKRRAADYEARLNNFNTEVDYWNKKGGAPKDVYDKLIQEQTTFDSDRRALQATAQFLNQSTEQYNTDVRQLDQAINTFNTTLQDKPEEGLYTYDNGIETIDIYFNDSQSELVHTLAHELGHALRIQHNPNAASIMYPQTSQTTTLSENDQSDLSAVCQKKNIVEILRLKMPTVIDRLRIKVSTLIKERN